MINTMMTTALAKRHQPASVLCILILILIPYHNDSILIPAWTRQKGQLQGKRKTPNPISIWALDTEGIVISRDARRHLDWLLDCLEPKAAILTQYRQCGYEMDFYCMWCGLGGTGGLMLSPYQMSRMAALQLTIGFEFWHEAEDE